MTMEMSKYLSYPLEGSPGILYRPNTSDIKAIEEVMQGGYERKDFRPEAGELWFDLGANIGAFSLKYAPVVQTILAFEPDADSYAVLMNNIYWNRLENVLAFDFAVTNSELPEINFYTNEATGAHWRNSAYIKQPRSQKYAVKNVHFREVLDRFGEHPINIKMDIEGAEQPILEDIDYGNYEIRKLVFEWSFELERRTKYFYAAMEKLKQSFQVVHHREINGDYWQKSWFPPCTTVFCLKEAPAK